LIEWTNDKIGQQGFTEYVPLASASSIPLDVTRSADPSRQVSDSGASNCKLGGGGVRTSFGLCIRGSIARVASDDMLAARWQMGWRALLHNDRGAGIKVAVVADGRFQRASIMLGLVYTENAISPQISTKKRRRYARRRDGIAPCPASPDGRSRHTRAAPRLLQDTQSHAHSLAYNSRF
jgi:hypothetical protein